jgi:hypothetical protein
MYKINQIVFAFSFYATILLFSPTIFAQCYVTGCNNRICSSDIIEDFGQCEWRVEDQCYVKYGVCEEDQNGECNWRQTIDLQQCVATMKKAIPPSIIKPGEEAVDNQGIIPCRTIY